MDSSSYKYGKMGSWYDINEVNRSWILELEIDKEWETNFDSCNESCDTARRNPGKVITPCFYRIAD